MPDKMQPHCPACGKRVRRKKDGTTYAHECTPQGTAYDPADCPVCNPGKKAR